MKRVLSLALLLSLVSLIAVADGPETGRLSGTVTTVDGTALPGVLVTITSERGSKSVMTTSDGKYRFMVGIRRASKEGVFPGSNLPPALRQALEAYASLGAVDRVEACLSRRS